MFFSEDTAINPHPHPLTPPVRAIARALLFVLTLLASSAANPEGAYTVDITKLLRERSNIDSELASLCKQICAGNEAKGWLQQAFLHMRPDSPTSEIEAQVRLRSRHVPVQGVVLYDDTAHVEVRADVDNQTCQVSNVRVSSNNDIYKVLIALFRTQLDSMNQNLKPPCSGQS